MVKGMRMRSRIECAPGVVEGVHPALVRPRVSDRVQTLVAEVAGVHLADHGERAIEMGVPNDRPDRDKRGGHEREVGVQRRLQQNR